MTGQGRQEVLLFYGQWSWLIRRYFGIKFCAEDFSRYAQTISDKEEGAARHLSKCRFYPSNSAGLSIAKKEEENVGTQGMTVHTEMCIWRGAEEERISGQYRAYFVLLGSTDPHNRQI